jgi:hypothetical protein
MRSEDEIQSDVNSGLSRALKALGESDRALEAPPEVEAKLRAAFQRRAQETDAQTSRSQRDRGRGRSMGVWRWVPALAAAAILAIVAFYYRGPRVDPVRVTSGVEPGATPMIQPHVVQPQIIHTHPRITGARTAQTTRRNAGRAPNSQPQEIATDFFPLVDFAPPTDNVDGGELVRVSLPASAMREVGLPVREDRLDDRVQADVLVSNGMATAIRFVKNMQ